MAKTKKAESAEPTTVAAAHAGNRALARLSRSTQLATQVAREYPIPVQQCTGQSLQLSVGVQNFRTVAVSFGRRRMDIARTRAEAASSAAKDKLTAATAALGKLGDMCLATFQIPADAQAVLAALNAYAPKPYVIKIERKDSQCYSDNKDKALKLDDEAFKHRAVTGEIRFYRADGNNYGRIDELDKLVAIPFTPELLAQADEIEALMKAAETADADRRAVNAAAARVEERADDVETALTLAHLQGQIKSTQDIYQLIVQVMFDEKAVPARVRKFLPRPGEIEFSVE